MGIIVISLFIILIIIEIRLRLFVTVCDMGPSFSKCDPFYGKRLKRNFNCRRITREFTINFNTNSLGFCVQEPQNFLIPL